VHLLHRSGCRISELLALNIDDIDLSNCKFQVLGKGNKQRYCYFSSDAASVLSQYIKYERHTNINALFTAQQPVTKITSRISYRTVHESWRELISIYRGISIIRTENWVKHFYINNTKLFQR
jgi:integrase/recombinase XerD